MPNIFAGFVCTISGVELKLVQMLVIVVPIVLLGLVLQNFIKIKSKWRYLILIGGLVLVPISFIAGYIFILPWGCPLWS